MARVSREALLQALEAVQPGLAKRTILEQSDCFVFRDGEVFTYNDELCCRALSGLPQEFTGAVPSKKLLELLQKLTEEEIEVEARGEELRITGKLRRAGFRLENEIVLPLENVDVPDKKAWKPLPTDFAEAVKLVQHCVSKDESQFAFTCIHVTPDRIEACDNFQAARWEMRTGFGEPLLLRQGSIRHVPGLGLNEVAETPHWIHFRGPDGRSLACRRYLEEYRDLSSLFAVKGQKVQLPRGLAEAAEKAALFSEENVETDLVTVELAGKWVKVKGRGTSGWYTERKKVSWTGPAITFLIAPQLLIDLVAGREADRECTISEHTLHVQSGSYSYVTVLHQEEEPIHSGEKVAVEQED